jgi:S-DNA-T family DNA segregation ATPase FtsK/SpoIIIE
MDEFDIKLSNLDGGRHSENYQLTQKVVRRHNNPDPTPTKPFEQSEPEYQTVDNNPPAATKQPVRQQQTEQTQTGGEPVAEQPKRTPRRRQRERKPSAFSRFIHDRRLHLYIGIVAIIIGGAMLKMLVSHLTNAAEDQSRVLNESIPEIVASGEQVSNSAGPFGAWLSHVLFTDALGLGSLVIAVYFCFMGGLLIAQKKFSFWSLTFKTLLLAVTTSIVAGFIAMDADSVISWGGTHGHYINLYLYNISDIVGPVVLSLILIAAVCCVFYNPIKNAIIAIGKILPSFKRPTYESNDVLSDDYNLDDEDDDVDSSTSEPTKEELDNIMPVGDFTAEQQHVVYEHDAPIAPTSEPEQKQEQPADDQSFVIERPQVETIPVPAPAPQAPKNETVFSIDNDNDDEKSIAKEQKSNEPGFVVNVATLDEGGSGYEPNQAVLEQGEYDHRADLSHFNMPTIDLLEDRPVKQAIDMEEQQQNKDRIVKTLGSYNIAISSIKATVGPTVTLYEIVPAEGIRIKQIQSLENDIAMSLAAKGIRIIAPIPGKGAVGIEVPNNDPQTVSMRTVLSSRKFQEAKMELPVAFGATISNDVFVTDLAKMPHALVAGATGQGKSVGLNALIASLLYRKHPSELKFVLIDPKMVEFSLYAKLKDHYLAKLDDDNEDAIITDPNRVLAVLNSLCVEMDNRYALLKDAGTREIIEYNKRFTARRLNPEKGHRYLPYIVVVIDEFADLIMTGGKDIESPVTRITQKARAVGIHMVIATQRPSTNVLTGLIKANCPARVAFRVNQMVDSRTILDCPGANQLIGRGDMLYSAGGAMERVQCAFISTDEVERLCDYISQQQGYPTPYMLPDPLLAAGGGDTNGGGFANGGLDRDPLFDEAARFTVSQATASTSSLQRRYGIGYNRAGKIMDQMEAIGIVGPVSGSKPRAILVDTNTLERILSQN